MKPWRPVLAAALVCAATACSAGSAPEPPDASRAPETSANVTGSGAPADAEPVAAVMPDVVGGNAGRAQEQMGPGTDIVFEDATGQGRSVDDPAGWRICTTRPGPNRQITDYPVVLGVVRTSEQCGVAAPG
ncbi:MULTISPECIES: hypothetical protein [unclassified Streptomyces]|uniref:hypothetical protein n=1 Tax=unclassified Streptomyces TaxID=2593676 RepID=UPI000F6F34FD|nr:MULTISPECIES: hypothetical protein [unclassified Streptomyces]AZM62439.1 hypothetical protein DLM49_25495 [Streptomyces sp. WAC 01438]RSM93534.1 hypothetical protein DMA10_21310 [Streptomyces sp. WAC 01420]